MNKYIGLLEKELKCKLSMIFIKACLMNSATPKFANVHIIGNDDIKQNTQHRITARTLTSQRNKLKHIKKELTKDKIIFLI